MLTRFVGAWRVDMFPATVVAFKRLDGVYVPVASARVTRFPIGYRVSRVWTAEVPKTVVTAANGLAQRLTKVG